MKIRFILFAAVVAGSATAALAQVTLPGPNGIPSTGIGPAPTGVVPGGVVPVPAPNTTPTPGTITPTPGMVTPAPNYTAPNPVGTPPMGAAGVPSAAGIGTPSIGTPSIGTPATGTSRVNTFSEQQVRSSLLAQGYTSVSGLSVDGSGTWHGTAVQNGANVGVMIDSNGIVTPR